MNKLNHVAFIMDGNGRWGKKKNKGRNYGHLKGVETVKKIVTSSLKFKIPIVTFYVFSSENWKRPKKEINFLFKILEKFLLKKTVNLIQNGIKLYILGDKKKFSTQLQKIIKISEKKTFNNKKLQINLALNYGSKEEIVNSCKNLLKRKKLITEKNIEDNMYTKNIPNPDLLIRTGNTNRLSNFLLWQVAYTEIFFIKKLWPEFNTNDYKKILNKFRLLKRNFGSI